MIYIYGISSEREKKPQTDINGIRDESISWITHENLSAAVSHLPENEELSLVDARIHDRVLQTLVEKNDSIIPMSFGFSLDNEDMVLSLIKQGKKVFQDTLDKIENRVQVDLEASWDMKVMEEALLDEEVNSLLAESKENPEDLPLKIELGRKVNAFLSKKEEELHPILLSLIESADSYKEKTIKGKNVMLNTSLLLRRDKKPQFLKELEEIEERLEGRITIQAVLPLPPYDFVDITVKKTDFNELARARKILGVSVECDLREIESSYSKLVKTYHPDKSFFPDAEERFREIRNAYETVKNFYDPHSPSSKKREKGEVFIFRAKNGETKGGQK